MKPFKEYFDLANEKMGITIRHTINLIKNRASYIHDNVCNQKYGDGLPYSYHLKMVADTAIEYGHLYCEHEHHENHILPIVFGAYFHDAIEDARMTYNDVLNVAEEFMTHEQAVMATEIVYALTDEKGRNRAERGSAKHYADIRATLYAPFVKWCDRYCNWKYSVETGSRMAEVYTKEMPEFIDKLGGDRFLPKELIGKVLPDLV